ncbi:MAG: hypothetical protein LC754_14630 [Acidobacteria bacterium]|nr:hypothetical protein [Acidobacteriota bacterium]
MESTEIQNGLRLLSSDAGLRERFFRDPLRVGRELGLSAVETRRLAQLSAPQVRTFGPSLHNPRFLHVCKVLPLTHRSLKESFTEIFQQYASAHAPGEISRHMGDALTFALFAEKNLRGERLQPRWMLDLLRYERARLQAADPARRVVVCYFRHDISRLVRSVARREEAPSALARSTVAVWWRPRARGVVRYAVLLMPRLPRRRAVQEPVA